MEENTMEVTGPLDYVTLALFELLGTAVLTLAMNFGYKTGPDIVSAGLFVGILLTYRVTGSHLNGGVTVGVAIVENASSGKKLKVTAAYIIGQLLGGYLGMLIAYGMLGYTGSMDMAPNDLNDNVFYVMLIEFINSWIFLTIYLYAKIDWVAPSQDFGLRAFTMMGVQYACTSFTQKITGGALNPSIGFCACTFRAILLKDGDISNIKFLASYLVAPILAGTLAGVYIRYFAIKVTPPVPENAVSPIGQRRTTKKLKLNSLNESKSHISNTSLSHTHLSQSEDNNRRDA